jgi:hypothetical protein
MLLFLVVAKRFVRFTNFDLFVVCRILKGGLEDRMEERPYRGITGYHFASMSSCMFGRERHLECDLKKLNLSKYGLRVSTIKKTSSSAGPLWDIAGDPFRGLRKEEQCTN